MNTKMNNNVDNDEFVQHSGKVVITYVLGQEKPTHGRLISVSKDFLSLQLRHGDIVTVAKKGIISLRPIRFQPSKVIL